MQKHRAHKSGLPSMAAGGESHHSIFLCYAGKSTVVSAAGNVVIQSFCVTWKTDRRANKNGKPHMEWSCRNSRGRQVGRRKKQRRAPFREKTSVFSVAGTHLPFPTFTCTRLHVTVACAASCFAYVRMGGIALRGLSFFQLCRNLFPFCCQVFYNIFHLFYFVLHSTTFSGITVNARIFKFFLQDGFFLFRLCDRVH